MLPWLEIKNATVFRGDHKVFERLNLDISVGQHTAVIGPNGAGKSTLLKLISREVYPVVEDDAWVKILGSRLPVLEDIRGAVGMVSQDMQNQYLGHVTGLDAVISGLHGSIGLWKHQTITDTQKELALQKMTSLGITELADKRYRTMSTGQQRLCLLGRAMIHDPDHYVLDEPTSGLDLRATFDYIRRVRELASAGKTVVLVTHHIHEIPPEVDRVVFLKNGAKLADGSKNDLLTTQNLSELFDTPVRLKTHDGFYQAFPD